jgi:hypothetical protein
VHHRVAEPTRTWGLPFPFVEYSNPLALFLYFLYPHTVDIVNFKFRGMCAHFVFNYVVYFKVGFYFLL